jgi:hypothetical protein
MPLTHPFDVIINRVKNTTRDQNLIFWSKPELIDYINEGQEEYCEKTMTLRAEAPLTTRENSQIYNLPVDCYIVDRIEREDGVTLLKTSSRDLESRYGSTFRTSTGTPTHYYQDLDGQGQLRFYPTPETDLRAEYETIDAELGGIISSTDDDAVDETYSQELGEVVDTDADDDTAYDTFDFENGVVTGVISTEGKFRVFYSRKPRANELEVSDVQALSYYALHKCFEVDGAFQDLNKSIMYENKFQERVNTEATRVYSAYHGQLRTKPAYV